MKRLALACLLALACAPAASTAAARAPAAAPAPASAGVPRILTVPRPKGGEWMGLYVLGKKAGWAFSQVREGEHEGKKAVVAVSVVTLKASVGGRDMMREVRDERFYEFKDGGRLLAFRQEKRGDGGEEILSGRCTPEAVELKRIRPGQPDETRKLPPTVETLDHADAPRLVAATRKKLETSYLDLERTLADKKTATEYLGEGTFTAAGVSVPVVKVKTLEEDSNLAVVTAIARDGRELEVSFGEVMVGRSEPEATAKRLEAVDIFNLTRITLDKPFPDAMRTPPASITWRVRGLGRDLRIASDRQRVEEKPDGSALLTISTRLPQATASRPVAAGDRKELSEALKPGLAVESDAPAIIARAREVVGGEKDAWAAARKINAFVNGYLEKSYGSSSDRATDVLATAKGDCTEHALLMTALLRASGIPARRVDGLVYMQASDGVPALYWHEWVEAWVGEWVQMDPTFNEEVADPTHIAFGTEAHMDTAGLIGRLKIEPVKISAPAGK